MSAERPVLFADPEFGQGMDHTLAVSFAVAGMGNLLHEEIEVQQDILRHAASIGLDVIVKEYDEADLDARDTYRVRGVRLPSQQQLDIVRTAVPDIAVAEAVDYATYEREPFLPAVAKYKVLDGGEGKYLLEDDEQRRRFAKFVTNDTIRVTDDPQHPDISRPVDAMRTFKDAFEMERFIATPGDRFTSYRVVASASGAILAGALLYSAHTKDQAPHITDGSSAKRLGEWGTNLRRLLEHPASNTYLHSRHFMSNLQQGGRAIVLDPTECSRPATEQDKVVLEAHGINPDRPALPERVRCMGSAIGRTLGRCMDIAVGIDFMQEHDSGVIFYQETNAGQGTETFRLSHLADAPQMTDHHVVLAMNRAALDSLAAS